MANTTAADLLSADALATATGSEDGLTGMATAHIAVGAGVDNGDGDVDGG
jgi:hypothetical protein